MPPPEHSPLGGPTGRIARAAQAYAYSLENGGTTAEAEAAASRFDVTHEMPIVASMARGAIKAASAFGAERAGQDYQPGGRQYRNFREGMEAAAQEGMTSYLATVVYYTDPVGTSSAGFSQEARRSAIQVDVPIGLGLREVQELLREAAMGAAEDSEYGYAGEYAGFSVLTIIGH